MNWGWHYRYDDNNIARKVGIWFIGTPYNYKIYIPLPSQLWIR